MMAAGDHQIQSVQEATDIVALIGEQIRLQPRGKEFVGLCPFHDDKRPSLHVSPAKQIYKCFSCGAGGNAYQWMTNYHKMTFAEALKFLAERAGITLRPHRSTSGQPDDRASDRQLIGQANARALNFFCTLLNDSTHGSIARDYLEQRGISSQTTATFQIGYAPDRWDGLVATIEHNGWNASAYRLAGLIATRQQGQGDYDRLRHRLIFPIFDSLGRPIGFGGRILPGGTIHDPNEAKYLNSPETVLFNKSQTLYGLHLAKKPIMDCRCAVVVEGYTDVIACHQAGFTNVVATLGTAFTVNHAQLLKRFADKVVLIFDADEAGQQAADRAVEVLMTGGLDVAVAVLPTGTDPADLLAEGDGPQRWQQLTDNAADALEYQFQRVQAQLDAQQTMAGRQRVAEQYIRLLAQMGLARQSMIRQAMIVAKLAGLLHLGERQVSEMVRHFSARSKVDGSQAVPESQTTSPGGSGPAAPQQIIGPEAAKKGDFSIALPESGHRIKALQMAERQLIGALLIRPSLFHQALADGRTLEKAVTDLEMVSQSAQRLYNHLHQRLSQDRPMTLAGLLGELAPGQEQELCDLATEAEAEVERMTNNDDAKLQQVTSAAVLALLRFRNEQAYQQSRTGAQAQAYDDPMLKYVAEHQRANPSGARIARLTP